ncbi:hypothetical protein GCM10027429_33170 [Marivirga atlantica]|jgi:hypothetical protein|uniref:M28 family peptidase n=1 Tax=Marivirga atlantica TaxID=1548457 RepID=A0A937DLA7_9BACT|nr:M28 family peptidase [Marivirga atlantica]MBL0766894.1 M28 family peptidase [Marivirga atlantica]
MIKYTLTLIACLLVNLSFGQINEKAARKYAATIDYKDLQKHLSILASDSLEGRETAKKGQKMAAAYIKEHFKKLGLQAPVNSSEYFQTFNLYLTKRGASELIVNNDTLKNLKEIVYWSDNPIERSKVTFHFVNKATEDDLKKFDVKDKFVVFKADGQFTPVLSRLEESGARGALVIADDSAKMDLVIRYGQYYVTQGSLSRNKPENDGIVSMVTYREVASNMFDKNVDELKIGDQVDAEIFGEVTTSTMETENVLGYLEGGEKKDELIVITAHYDHEGIKGNEIYNGADDDASGTTAVLEIAEAFAKAKKDGFVPTRSILFMPVTGEEKGLLGSAYYSENPVFPLENTVANLNIDMIGRLDSSHRNNREFVYLIGSNRISTQLHDISDSVNNYYTKLDLDYTYNAEDHPDRIYYRSDHWNFAKNGVPIIFYFNGIHKDYHRPTDTVDKIQFDLLKKRTDLVFYTAWELAFMEDRLKIDE